MDFCGVLRLVCLFVNRVIFVLLAIIFGVAALSLTVFVGTGGPKERLFEIRSDKNTVLFSVTPWGDPKEVKSAYKPLLKYLSERTGKKFQLLVMDDYDVAIENLADGNVDISVTSPVSYILAKEREPGLKYISTIKMEQGRATYKGYIIALKSRYKGMKMGDFLKDASKYDLGFVSKMSASGWSYPLAMMKEKGVDPFKSFKSVTVFDNHPDFLTALVDGRVDLGATWEYNLSNAVKRYGNIFEVLWETTPIPGLTWTASAKVDHGFVDKIRELQLEIESSPRLKEELLKDTPDKGWEVLNDAFYDEVRGVMKSVAEYK